MAIVWYVGDEDATDAFGVTFTLAGPVYLDGLAYMDALGKLRRNPQFMVTDWEPPKSEVGIGGLLAAGVLGHTAPDAHLRGLEIHIHGHPARRAETLGDQHRDEADDA